MRIDEDRIDRRFRWMKEAVVYLKTIVQEDRRNR